MTQWTFLCQLGNLEINQLTTYIKKKKKNSTVCKINKISVCMLVWEFRIVRNEKKYFSIHGYTTNLSLKKSTTCLKSSAQYSLFMSASTLSDAL